MWLAREDLQKEINYMMLGRRIFAYFNLLHPKKVKKILKKKVKEQYRIYIKIWPRFYFATQNDKTMIKKGY